MARADRRRESVQKGLSAVHPRVDSPLLPCLSCLALLPCSEGMHVLLSSAPSYFPHPHASGVRPEPAPREQSAARRCGG
eukprot:680227-Rhodomonas_salina.1